MGLADLEEHFMQTERSSVAPAGIFCRDRGPSGEDIEAPSPDGGEAKNKFPKSNK